MDPYDHCCHDIYYIIYIDTNLLWRAREPTGSSFGFFQDLWSQLAVSLRKQRYSYQWQHIKGPCDTRKVEFYDLMVWHHVFKCPIFHMWHAQGANFRKRRLGHFVVRPAVSHAIEKRQRRYQKARVPSRLLPVLWTCPLLIMSIRSHYWVY